MGIILEGGDNRVGIAACFVNNIFPSKNHAN